MAQFEYSGRISPLTLDGYTFTKGATTDVEDQAVASLSEAIVIKFAVIRAVSA